jgi:hypothetical protein
MILPERWYTIDEHDEKILHIEDWDISLAILFPTCSEAATQDYKNPFLTARCMAWALLLI